MLPWKKQHSVSPVDDVREIVEDGILEYNLYV